MNPSSYDAQDIPRRQDRAGAGGSKRRNRSVQAADHTGHRARSALRALRCHDVRCVEADQEIRDLLQRF